MKIIKILESQNENLTEDKISETNSEGILNDEKYPMKILKVQMK